MVKWKNGCSESIICNFDLDYRGMEKMAIREERRFYDSVNKVNYLIKEMAERKTYLNRTPGSFITLISILLCVLNIVNRHALLHSGLKILSQR